MSFQEYDYWGSRGGPLIFSTQRQMVHILGASSLFRVMEEFDYNSKRTLKKTITAIPGLSFNQNNKKNLKVIPTLLSKGRLSKISQKEKFIIWHDAVNNSLYRHPSNFNTRLSQSSYSAFSYTTSSAYQQLCTANAPELLTCFKNCVKVVS